MKRLFIYSLVALLLVGCYKTNRLNTIISYADSIMDIDQNKAKLSLSMLKTISPQIGELTKAERMRYYMVLKFRK
jgi:uncharacterized protein YcfL